MKKKNAIYHSNYLGNINRRFPIFRPLNNRNFRLLLLGEGMFLLGNQVHLVVLAWLALQLTGSGLALGSVLMTAAIPKALFMLFGGALSDRVSLKRLMLVSNMARTAIAASIAILVLYEAIALWHLYLFALLIGLADGLFHPALMTTIPRLLEQNKLEAGNALIRGATQASTLLGSAPAGLLISTVGISATFGIDAAFFLLAAVVLWFMTEAISLVSSRGSDVVSTPPHRFRLSSILTDIKDGLYYAWHKPSIRALLITVAVIHLSFTGPFTVGLASLADSYFEGGATDFGIILSSFGGGAMLGTIAAGLIVFKRRGLLLSAITAALGASLALISLTQNVVVVSLLAVLIGIENGLFTVMSFTWLQTTTAPNMVGRMMGFIHSSALVLAPVSFVLTGAIADVSPSLVFIVAGIPVLAISIYLVATRDFRQLN